jgi:hypothetical protein
MEYRDRRLVLSAIGILLLLVGTGSALLGPVEMYCFYLFSEGGRFHYEGFGFGSFMFGNIAGQIIGYYVIALLCIPLGYGHIKVRRWSRTLSVALLWSWLVVGLPFAVVFMFILLASKELSLAAALVAAVLAALSYFAVPGLLLRFYQSRDVRLTFEARDPRPCGLEELPIPRLVLCCLYLFYAIALHVPIFFNGLFPVFGAFLFGLQGIRALDLSIALLVLFAWGTLRGRPWAWWGALITVGLLTVSTTLTFVQVNYLELLHSLRFAPTEIEALDGIPLQGWHLAVFFGLPLLATLGAIVLSKRHFSTARHELPATTAAARE